MEDPVSRYIYLEQLDLDPWRRDAVVVVVAGKTVLDQLSLHGHDRRHKELAPTWVVLSVWNKKGKSVSVQDPIFARPLSQHDAVITAGTSLWF